MSLEVGMVSPKCYCGVNFWWWYRSRLRVLGYRRLFRSRFYYVYDVLQWIGLLGGSSEKVLFILVSVLMFGRSCFVLALLGGCVCPPLSRTSLCVMPGLTGIYVVMRQVQISLSFSSL